MPRRGVRGQGFRLHGVRGPTALVGLRGIGEQDAILPQRADRCTCGEAFDWVVGYSTWMMTKCWPLGRKMALGPAWSGGVSAPSISTVTGLRFRMAQARAGLR